jgi:hypothetical protein
MFNATLNERKSIHCILLQTSTFDPLKSGSLVDRCALNVVNIFLEPSKMHIIIQNSEYKVICPLNCHSSVGQRLMFEVKYSG